MCLDAKRGELFGKSGGRRGLTGKKGSGDHHITSGRGVVVITGRDSEETTIDAKEQLAKDKRGKPLEFLPSKAFPPLIRDERIYSPGEKGQRRNRSG